MKLREFLDAPHRSVGQLKEGYPTRRDNETPQEFVNRMRTTLYCPLIKEKCHWDECICFKPSPLLPLREVNSNITGDYILSEEHLSSNRCQNLERALTADLGLGYCRHLKLEITKSKGATK